jgi:hypothetical protein
MRAAAQNQMTVKSLAVPIITIGAITAAIFNVFFGLLVFSFYHIQ